MELLGLLCIIVPSGISFAAGYAWALWRHGWLRVKVGKPEEVESGQ